MALSRRISFSFSLWLAFVALTLAAVASAQMDREKSHDGGAHAEASNALRGKNIYETRCVGCHSLDRNRVGPKHRGVFGRAAAAAPDYVYSEALKNADLVWDADTLDKWLAGPMQLVPGTTMGFALPEPADRADVIDYLKSVSNQSDLSVGFKFPRLRRRCSSNNNTEDGCANDETIEFIELRTTQLADATRLT